MATGIPTGSSSGLQQGAAGLQGSSASGSSLAGPTAGGVQSSSSADQALTGGSGQALSSTPLSAVNLPGAASGTASTQQALQPAPQHHVSPALLGLAVLLVVFAIGSVWSVARSAKNTTI